LIMTNYQQYLESGAQTKASSLITVTTSKIDGEGKEFIKNACLWISKNLGHTKDKIMKSKVFRKRTAEGIIRDKYTTGCTDIALVFIALCRAKGIPTKYIEAVRKESDGSSGHVFAECFINNGWIVVDPTYKKMGNKTFYNGFDIIAEGIDSWDTGTESLRKLKEKTKEYRNNEN